MNCIKCGVELSDNSVFCNICGKKQLREKRKKARGNGQGSVFKLPNGKYKAVVTVGYYMTADGKKSARHTARCFKPRKRP